MRYGSSVNFQEPHLTKYLLLLLLASCFRKPLTPTLKEVVVHILLRSSNKVSVHFVLLSVYRIH